MDFSAVSIPEGQINWTADAPVMFFMVLENEFMPVCLVQCNLYFNGLPGFGFASELQRTLTSRRRLKQSE